MAHHVWGPSSLDALSKCVRFKYGDSDADAAFEGTLMHAACESGDLSGLDEEQRGCVESARRYAESLKWTGGSSPEAWEEMNEASVELEGLTHGTADKLLLNRGTGRLIVVDYKFTRRDSDHTLQLKAYGAGAAESLNRDYPGLVKTVECHVCAPRLGEIADPAVFDAGDLVREMRAEIAALYERIENPWTPPEPHADLCCKCARAAGCPALSGAAVSAGRGLGLPLPSRFEVGSDAPPKDRAVAQILAGALQNWAERVKKANAAFALAGGQVPFFRLVRRSTGLRVPKEKTPAAAAALKSAFPKLADDALAKCCTLTVGDAARAAAEAHGMSAGEAMERMRDVLTGIAQEGFSEYLQAEKRAKDTELLGSVALIES
ncbi:MAG: DUF2800 domain-containing protein [Bacilli bacterium]